MEKKINREIKNSIDSDDDDDEKFTPKKEAPKASRTPVLDSFGRDLTRAAEEGKLDPVIGREREVERVCTILSRRRKNNTLLVGEAGCVVANTEISVRKISDEGRHNIIEINYRES